MIYTMYCDYPLLFNGNAKFDIEEKIGEDVFDAISPTSREGLKNLCFVAQTLSEQANLSRKYDGYDSGETLNADKLNATLTPIEIGALFEAVAKAILRGYGREIKDENEAVDLGLLELEKAKKKD